jgi:hypothetical protein
LNLQREEEIKNILSSRTNKQLQTKLNKNIKDLNDNLSTLTNDCEDAFKEYELRSRQFITLEVIHIHYII